MTEITPPRRRRLLLIICGIVAAMFVVAAIVVGTVLNGAMPSSKTASPATHSAAPAVPSAQPTSGVTSPAPFAAAPPSAGKRVTTEVEPGGSTSGALPLSTPLPALFSGPVPKSATKNGAVVKGFPSSIPVATSSKVTTSSVSSSSKTVQATLVARTTSSVADVVSFYTKSFAHYGVFPSPAAASGGSSTYAFIRDNDSVTITVTPASGGSRYSVFAVLHATS
jgi:hypothetical protein